MAVAFLICHLYQLKELEKLLLMVPLGGEKSHGQNELEPFPFPRGKQQFYEPNPAKVTKVKDFAKTSHKVQSTMIV